MKQFFKFMFASLVGFVLACVVMIFIFICIIAVTISAVESGQKVSVKPNSVLHIRFENEITDRSDNNPLNNIDFGSFKAKPALGLNDILDNIDKAKSDTNIKGVFLDVTHISAGYAMIEEIRNALQAFRDSSGKFIISYSDYYAQNAYYLCSVSDEIFLNPEGYLEWRGLSAKSAYLKGALEKLEIDPQVMPHGKYKSAGEPLSSDRMSEPNKEQLLAVIGSTWDYIISTIAGARNISNNELNLLADSLTIRNAEFAEKYRLVDKLMYHDEFSAYMCKKLGIEEDDKINYLAISKYTDVPRKREKGGIPKDRIAVVYAQGGIVTGKGEKDEIGSETISEAIREARLDKKVKAIVFRINSGGGSALASDVIWREVRLASQSKPVVASLSNVAASGGYYIACGADTIVTDRMTITGSIGVISFMPNAQKFFENKLGIKFDGVKTNAHSDLFSNVRALTTTERTRATEEMGHIYDVFTSHVAEGRKLDQKYVDSIGQGRIWSGTHAKTIGLVDEHGGLKDAIKIAATMAGLDKYRLTELPKIKDPLQQIMEEFGLDMEAAWLRYRLGEDGYRIYNYFSSLTKSEGVQARMPFHFEIE